MPPAKVAIIAGQLVVGGAERQLFLWLSNLNRDKFDVKILSLHPGQGDYWENPIKDLGFTIINIPRNQNRIQRFCQILRVLKSYDPDLIHGWHLFVSPYAGIAAKILKIPSIGSLRDSFRVFYKHPVSAYLTLISVNAIITNSYSAAKKVKRIKIFRSQRVIAIQNAYVADQNPEDSRNEISRKFNVNQELPWIGTVGRLDPKKRFDLMIRSISGIFPKKFHLFLIGDGNQLRYLEKLTHELEVSEIVTFTGEIPNAVTLMPSLDLFAFTSYDEGMPNVILEAAAAGLPIVTWDLDFYRELLRNGESAILVEPGNLKKFRCAIEELIDDPEKRKKMGSAAQDYILTTFTLEKYIQNMTNLYDQMLNQSQPTHTHRK